ncbi:MAG: DUF1214 domain-containing protein [Acidimicrobiia bacterium]
MTDSRPETAAAFHELLATLQGIDAKFYDGPAGPLDPPSLLEGYQWIPTILQVALDAYVWADADNPRFVDIVGPYKKWGGDNADASYCYAPIDPARTYRVRVRPGDAVYWSLTVYGGPSDGRYSERIVGTINDRDAAARDDGTVEIVISPHEQPGNWLRLEPDAVCAITRDYLIDPTRGRRCEWHVATDDPPATRRLTDAELARRFRAATTWVREQAGLVPLPLGEPNVVEEPYPVPTTTFGWAAGDAAYAMGSFELDDDHALVIDGTSPECAFWNLCLWNPFLHTYNYDYERVTINGGQVAANTDGSWTIVVTARDPGHPNWVSTAGHPRGRIWFRWFLPATTPSRPSTRVMHVGEVGRAHG